MSATTGKRKWDVTTTGVTRSVTTETTGATHNLAVPLMRHRWKDEKLVHSKLVNTAICLLLFRIQHIENMIQNGLYIIRCRFPR